MSLDLPNVVLVIFDAARRDRIGSYGYPRSTTPTVDSLARDGLLAKTMISNATWTPPSHASLFTGLYPSQHGAQWQTGPRMRSTVPLTMAEWFRKLGYQTLCVTNNGLISPRTQLSRGFDSYAARLGLERGIKRIRRRTKKVLFGGDSGGPIVNRWIRDRLTTTKDPFFLFVNYLECHWSYVPPISLEKRVGGPRFRPLEGLRYRAGLAHKNGPWEAIARADERTRRIYSTLYDAELASVDSHLRDLIGILEDADRFADGRTLLIVASDHGEHIGENGLADHHASLDDLLIRVPFVAWGPGLIPVGVQERMYEFVDVLPSLAKLLDRPLDAPHLDDRRSNLFTDLEEPVPNDLAFAEWRSWPQRELRRLRKRNPTYDFSGLDTDLVCVRNDSHKLVRRGTGNESLFDLHQDPGEERDIIASEAEVANTLRTALDKAVQAWGSWETGSEGLTDEDRRAIEEQLSSLGYI